MHATRTITAAATAALFACLTACGGGDDTNSPGRRASTAATGAGGAPVSERLDVAYVPDGTKEHTLDLFLPEGRGTGPFPVLVWVHGGGWRMGDKADLRTNDMKLDEFTKAVLDRGYAVAAPNYRLLPNTTFPEPLQDVAASVRYLRANAASLGLDPHRFALGGESAGAHLAALTALTFRRTDVQGTLGTTTGDTSVDAFVGFYGLYDLPGRTEDQQQACGGGGGEEKSHGRLIGADPDTPDGEKLAASASPLTYVHAGAPPALLFQGRPDCTAPHQQGERFAAALQKVGVPVELDLTDLGHADAAYYGDEARRDKVLAFLDAHVTR